MKKYILLLFIPSLFLGFVIQKSLDAISREDVQAAQKLIGISIAVDQIDTLIQYLESNRKGYDTMRTFSLAHDVAPALLFDPFPTTLVINSQKATNRWKINANIALPHNKEEIAFLSIADLAGLIKSRKISSVQLTQLYLDRIKRHDPLLQSFVTVTERVALDQAARADKELAAGKYRGPLHGIPYGVKDLAAFPGYPTTWGSAPYKDQYLQDTATVIRMLEEAGAVLLGKLVSGTLARGDVWFGGKTKNPWDVSQGASGSSAGPGSATAAGLVAFSIGTETLGSIISPSTRCGITGLRPTYGRVSKAGFMVLSWSMDKVGPMCRTATDCAMVLDAIIGKDNGDRSALDARFAYDGRIDVGKLKVGYFHQQFDSDTSTNSINNGRFLEELKKMGVVPDKVDLPQHFPFSVFDIILRAESGAFFDELVLSGADSLLDEQDKGSRANSLRQARFIPAVEYLQANRHRRVLIDEFHNLIKGYDVVISPTFGGRQMLITNLTGHPALSLPNGFDEKGRPTSVTLVGNYFDEEKLLALANAYQVMTTYEGNIPPNFKD